MKQVDSKEAVESFLLNVRKILNSSSFNINKNFLFIRFRASYSDNNLHTNDSTLIDLEYNTQDVVNEIKSLTTEHYKETFIDNQPGKINPFYCFIKTINNKQVYIKFKIKEKNNKQVLCVSFHFAEHDVSDNKLPYKK